MDDDRSQPDGQAPGEEAPQELAAREEAGTDPSNTVGREVLAALFERHNLPALSSMEPIAWGEAESTFLVNDEIVVRMNRRDPDAPSLAKVALIYHRLRRATDVPCPEVLALDRKRDLVPYDVLVLGRVPGVNAAEVWEKLDDEAREKLSEEVGRLIGTIHGLNWPAYGDFNVATNMIGQFPRWTDLLLSRLELLARQARKLEALPMALIDGAITELNDGDSVLETASRPTLVHGDLHTANLLLKQQDDEWHVAAILDWEEALAADAAWEFALLAFRRADEDPIGDAFLYGYRERHPIQTDLRSRTHLYRIMLHLEGAIDAYRQHGATSAQRRAHETTLRRLLRRS